MPLYILLQALGGVIVGFTGLKAAEYQDMQPSIERVADCAVAIDSGPYFEFYEIIKRDDLYPPLQNSDSD